MPTNYGYTDNIPAGGNDPSADRPLMTENFNSIDGLIGEDHVTFNNDNGGFHNQIRMPTMISMPSPSIRISNSTTQYSKVINGGSNLFMTNGQSVNEYQLTRVDNTNFPTFAQNPGWTFLPGGLIFQYGMGTSSTTIPTTNANAVITYPFPYTTGTYSVNCTILTTTNNRIFVQVYDVTTNQFRASVRDSGGLLVSGVSFFWQAVGS